MTVNPLVTAARYKHTASKTLAERGRQELLQSEQDGADGRRLGLVAAQAARAPPTHGGWAALQGDADLALSCRLGRRAILRQRSHVATT